MAHGYCSSKTSYYWMGSHGLRLKTKFLSGSAKFLRPGLSSGQPHGSHCASLLLSPNHMGLSAVWLCVGASHVPVPPACTWAALSACCAFQLSQHLSSFTWWTHSLLLQISLPCRSLADRAHKASVLRDVFPWVPVLSVHCLDGSGNLHICQLFDCLTPPRVHWQHKSWGLTILFVWAHNSFLKP